MPLTLVEIKAAMLAGDMFFGYTAAGSLREDGTVNRRCRDGCCDDDFDTLDEYLESLDEKDLERGHTD